MIEQGSAIPTGRSGSTRSNTEMDAGGVMHDDRHSDRRPDEEIREPLRR